MPQISPFFIVAVILLALVAFVVVLDPLAEKAPAFSPQPETPSIRTDPTAPHDTGTSIQKMVRIVSVSGQSTNPTIRFKGLTALPEGSGILYEIWPADISTRKITSDVDGISGRVTVLTENGTSFWLLVIDPSSWHTGMYIINAWPEETDPRYGDRKTFAIPINRTVAQGTGIDSGNGEILLFEMEPSATPAGIVVVTPAATPVADNAEITVNPISMYPVGKTITISGTTTLPAGEVLDIAWIKEPFHTTKCDPDTFCGAGTYATNVTAGEDGNVWSFTMNTSGFTEGGYDIWVITKNLPNTSVHTSLYLRKA